MNKSSVWLFSLLLLLIAVTRNSIAQKEPTVGSGAMYSTKTIVENAVNSPIHTTLVAAIKAGGLIDTLNSSGPFTVFAPTNDAFAKLPAGIVDTLVKPENKDLLDKILTYHVVPGRISSKEIMKDIKKGGGTATLKTVQGEPLTFTMSGGKILITDANGGTANITTADVFQSNGVIDVIDSVLLPDGDRLIAKTHGDRLNAKAAPTPPTNSSSMRRVSGTSLLSTKSHEESGFGLYSYALLAHSPNEEEEITYKAFFTALLSGPTAHNLELTVEKARINITQIPVTRDTPKWDIWTTEEQVKFVSTYYNYARAAAILSCLPKKTGTGPVIVSVLTPVDVSKTPHPVLVSDLTTYKPRMMRVGVDMFNEQAGKEEFWDESALDRLGQSIRNALEVLADGTGMTKDAVDKWIQLFRSK